MIRNEKRPELGMLLNACRRSNERLVGMSDKRPKPIAGLPSNFVHDKDVIIPLELTFVTCCAVESVERLLFGPKFRSSINPRRALCTEKKEGKNCRGERI